MSALLSLTAGCKQSEGLAQLPENPGASGPAQVRTAQVRVVMDRDKISATGMAAPTATTKVMPLVPGLITKLPIKEGDVVKRGQVIVVQDARQFLLTRKQAEAAIQGAMVAVGATTREKKRFGQLMKEDAMARAKYEQVLDKYNGAQAQLKSAQVALEMARKALGDTTIRAPYDGVVVKILSSVGDYATSMPPTVILVMMEIKTLELKVALPEPELQRVEAGAAASVHFPSMQRTLQASITRIVRNVDPMTGSFEIVIEIPNADLTLKPGLFARVQIDASKPRRRVLVPNEAVVDEGSGVYTVFVIEGSVARRRQVRVSTASGDRTEVISGLTGTELLVLDSAGLLDGDTVKLQPAAAAASKPTAEASK